MKNLPAPILYLTILAALLVAGIGWSVFGFWSERVFQIVLGVAFGTFLLSMAPGLLIEFRQWRARRATKRNAAPRG